MKKGPQRNNVRIFVLAGLALLISILTIASLVSHKMTPTNVPIIISNKPNDESFEAPGKDWPSQKKVEDYFVEHLRMSPQEAQEIRTKPGVDGKVMLRIREHTTVEGLLGNLEYYGFIRDKEALRYALEHTTDTMPGKATALTVGENTIDAWAYYRISEDMTAWEIADELLNHPTYFSFDEYNYTFMP